MTLKEILEYNFISFGEIHLSLYHILLVLFILLFAKIAIWIFLRLMQKYFTRKKVDRGRQYAFIQVLKYIVYTLTLFVALEAVGVKLSLVWGGAAALLVGIGLGLQQTFNDIISGLILLIEGTVEVDDIIEISGLVGSVTHIGIRTSKILTRDKISVIIPNSKLVVDNAINWSHDKSPTRFKLMIGISYDSDIELASHLLIQAAKEHSNVLKMPEPQVQFSDFGNSSLDFNLYFFSLDYLGIEFTKSEIRYRIIELFRQNDIKIPFPQRDLWLRNPEFFQPEFATEG